MNDRLPPLTALRAFEAAARHMSFAQAAAELHVTPAALSFQIKSLEEHLGQPLFRRLNRAVELTEAGRALQPDASAGFDTLRRGWRAAQRVGDTNTLTVTAGPAFTAKWLAPRLFLFAQAHPEIELRFSASLRIMDFELDEVDVAIRFGTGQDEGLYSHDIFDEWLTPMMTPSLAERVTTPTDLSRETLLRLDDITDISQQANWRTWFTAAGLGDPPKGGPRFDQADHAIDAAAAGAGIALARISLAYSNLVDGSLVAPFPLALRTDSHYRFVCPIGGETRPQNAMFLDWLLSEAQEMKRFNTNRHIVHVSEI
ncbi:MAG: transcriptional regulator GcvA [Pseudomonadota bacterium]